MSPDIAASIKGRLLNQARARGEEFELVLVRYGCERFLHRLGVSELSARCILKGASLLGIWMPDPYRATRDVDLLASGRNDAESIRAAMDTVCRIPCHEDGLVFDLSSLSVTPIREEQKYAGQRAVLPAYLGKTRIRLQVDFGFGDSLPAPPQEAELPTLLPDVPAPRLRAYPRVATLAEKFEAMVHLGRRNSRMKDFHDVWALSETFPFDGPELRDAVATCFARRGTPWTPTLPDVLTPAFPADPNVVALWRAYHDRGQFRAPPPGSIDVVVARVRDFLGPVRQSIVRGEPFEQQWQAGGPWRHEQQDRAGGGTDA